MRESGGKDGGRRTRVHVEFRAFLPGIEKKTDRSKLLLPHVSDDVATSTGTISRFFEKRRGDIYIYIYASFLFFPEMPPAANRLPSLVFFSSSPLPVRRRRVGLLSRCIVRRVNYVRINAQSYRIHTVSKRGYSSFTDLDRAGRDPPPPSPVSRRSTAEKIGCRDEGTMRIV